MVAQPVLTLSRWLSLALSYSLSLFCSVCSLSLVLNLSLYVCLSIYLLSVCLYLLYHHLFICFCLFTSLVPIHLPNVSLPPSPLCLSLHVSLSPPFPESPHPLHRSIPAPAEGTRVVLFLTTPTNQLRFRSCLSLLLSVSLFVSQSVCLTVSCLDIQRDRCVVESTVDCVC